MKWLATLLLVLTWNAAGQSSISEQASATNAPRSVPELQQRLQAVIDDPLYATALWGAKVVSLDTGSTLFEHNAGKLFSPASNCKLYTVALGLHRLGADYRIKTSVYARSTPDASGVLAGDLVVFGRGDPTIKSAGTSATAALQPLVNLVTNAGIKRIRGRLIADESYFRGPEFGSGWSWDDQHYYYGAEISALTVQDNLLVMTVRPGAEPGAPCEITFNPPMPFMRVHNRTTTGDTNASRTISFYRQPSRNILYVSGRLPLGGKVFTDDVPVHDPARMFVELFAEALERNGVSVEGSRTMIDWLDRQQTPANWPEWVELGRIESPPLKDIAAKVQKPSQNLYTDLLLAHVGERSRNSGTPASKSSEELGVAEMTKFLTEAGIGRGQYFIEEGSGLSRDNLVTPSATIALLKFMSTHKDFEAYKTALPIAGVDGTLRNRMKDTAAAGNVRAKTGSLRWASSLSGYVTTAAGENLAFSFMVNRYHPAEPARSSRADLDTLTVLLANFAGKSAE